MGDPINFEAATLAFLLQLQHGAPTLEQMSEHHANELLHAGLLEYTRHQGKPWRDRGNYELTALGRDVVRAMLYAGLEEYRRPR